MLVLPLFVFLVVQGASSTVTGPWIDSQGEDPFQRIQKNNESIQNLTFVVSTLVASLFGQPEVFCIGNPNMDLWGAYALAQKMGFRMATQSELELNFFAGAEWINWGWVETSRNPSANSPAQWRVAFPCQSNANECPNPTLRWDDWSPDSSSACAVVVGVKPAQGMYASSCWGLNQGEICVLPWSSSQYHAPTSLSVSVQRRNAHRVVSVRDSRPEGVKWVQLRFFHSKTLQPLSHLDSQTSTKLVNPVDTNVRWDVDTLRKEAKLSLSPALDGFRVDNLQVQEVDDPKGPGLAVDTLLSDVKQGNTSAEPLFIFVAVTD